MSDPTVRTQAQRWRDAVLHRGPGYDLPARRVDAVTGDLLTARVCRALAAAAAVAAVWLAAAHHPLAAVLVLWLAPCLLLVGGRAHRAHTRRKEGRS
jgi:hypothetical protein